MSCDVPVIAVDGPVGSGKGTVSALVADRLGFHLLESGAIYRALALTSLRKGVSAGDREGLVALARGLDVGFERKPGGELHEVLLDGEAVGTLIRDEGCAQRSSQLAADPAIREAVLENQRAFRRAPGLVAEGRDMGTVVFPDAFLKVYLTASIEERARRRHKQLVAKGFGVSLPYLLGEISQRDRRDQERPVAPLRPARDAIVIDTTTHAIEAVVEMVMAAANAQGLNSDRGSRRNLHSAMVRGAFEDENAPAIGRRCGD